MKLFNFYKKDTDIANQYDSLNFYLKPETSMKKANSPFFLPDFSKDIRCNIGLVIKICKLGKSIKEKFANNYYKEYSLCVNFTAVDLLDENIKKGLAWDKAVSFDGSTVIGNFEPCYEVFSQTNLECKVNFNNKTQAEFSIIETQLSFNKAIEEISKYYTLKIGDYLMIEVINIKTRIQIEDFITVYLSDEKKIEFKIK